mgnify:CR=1 FL=1
MYSIKIKLDVVLGYKGMTLKELSEKTGLTISNLSNIKNNRHPSGFLHLKNYVKS